MTIKKVAKTVVRGHLVFEDVDKSTLAELTDEELPIYLSGNVISRNTKGYVCVMYKQIPLGFGKGDGMMIKNKYPKGLRIMGTGGITINGEEN